MGTAPRTVSEFRPGEPARLRKATAAGHFRLYAGGPDGKGSGAAAANTTGGISAPPPVVSRWLARGQALGFVRAEGGAVMAVAAGERFAISPGAAHRWVMEPDPRQVDRTQTGLLLTVLAVAGVVAALLVAGWATPDFGS